MNFTCRLYASAGEQTWGKSHAGKPKPLDVPKQTVVRLRGANITQGVERRATGLLGLAIAWDSYPLPLEFSEGLMKATYLRPPG